VTAFFLTAFFSQNRFSVPGFAAGLAAGLCGPFEAPAGGQIVFHAGDLSLPQSAEFVQALGLPIFI